MLVRRRLGDEGRGEERVELTESGTRMSQSSKFGLLTSRSYSNGEVDWVMVRGSMLGGGLYCLETTKQKRREGRR